MSTSPPTTLYCLCFVVSSSLLECNTNTHQHKKTSLVGDLAVATTGFSGSVAGQLLGRQYWKFGGFLPDYYGMYVRTSTMTLPPALLQDAGDSVDRLSAPENKINKGMSEHRRRCPRSGGGKGGIVVTVDGKGYGGYEEKDDGKGNDVLMPPATKTATSPPPQFVES